MLDEHAEWGAPVTDVVLPDDLVASEFSRAAERVADHRRPQMPDVHLLGDVRCRIVDRDDLWRVGLWHAEPLIGPHRTGLRGDPRIAQRQVDEARSADLDARENVVGIEV